MNATQTEKIKAIRDEYRQSLRALDAGERDDAEHAATGTKCLARLRRMLKCSRSAAWQMMVGD